MNQFKIEFYFIHTFFNQTYILVAFINVKNDFIKKKCTVHDTGLDTQRIDKKKLNSITQF